MFFEYHQNNSGGSFEIEPERGIAPLVIIEADDAVDADDSAVRIGLYFNGCDLGLDCYCCGDRWYPAWSGTEQPEVYGRVIADGKVAEPEQHYAFSNMKWADGPEGYIHYKDGRIEPFDY